MSKRISEDWAGRAGRVLCRPAFVLAVAVLVLNDHVLKGAGLLPPAVTGKLSDVAGLFFFPVLLAVGVATLLRPKTYDHMRRLSAAATIATMTVFGVINASPTVAAALTDMWSVWVADPTDLLCLPLAAFGHIWFLRNIETDSGFQPGRARKLAMALVAAGAAIATQPKSPDSKLLNETDDSLSFVDTDATIVYESSDDSTVRTRVDGSKVTELADRKLTVESFSRSGDRVLLRDSKHLFLYRDGSSGLKELPDFEGRPRYPLLSPAGEFAAVPVEAGETNAVETLELYQVESGTREVLRDGIDSETYLRIGWSSDGSTLYFRNSTEGSIQYEVASGDWSAFDTESVAWDELHHARDPSPRKCRDDAGVWRLEDPASDGEFDDYEGVHLVGPDGESEVLIEIELEEEIDNPNKFESPFDQTQFVGDCKHVVFTMEDDSSIRVVEAESKKMGTIAEGSLQRVTVVPKHRQ